jgi:eukaryotic-like serine/threonine-protein kinase
MRHQPGERIDRYEVIDLLGQGAYAETYKARDTASGEIVVLKSPNPNLFADPAIFQRFRRERDIADKLSHPNVVGGRDHSENRTEPYLVLEYVDGTNLRTRMAQLKGEDSSAPISVPIALEWGRQLASVLEYLHTQGIVHRDLKPENILVTDGDQLKLIDFGTALLEGAKRLTWKHLTDGLGTPDYMSPEQIQGARGDERSDIYAWGVMMYELLTGAVPFDGDNWMAVMAGHLTKTPPRIRARNPAVPPALEAVVLEAMRRYPEHRYQSSVALAHDIGHLDEVDPSAFDLSPEAPMGGMAAADSTKRLWIFALLVAAGFIAVASLIIFLSVVLR